MKQALTVNLFLAAGLALVACNRPAPIQGPPPEFNTTVAASSRPSLEPSLTPPPSATLIITPSPTFTSTPDVSATPSPTAPPLPTDDPRYGINIASPHYRDVFDSQVTWVGPNFEGAVNVWDDGRHRATDKLADGFIWWSTTVPEADAGNLYVELEVDTDACSGKDSYGLAIRVGGEGRNSGYALEFSCDGAYRLRKFSEGAVQTLIGWTPSSSIQSGSNAKNEIGLLAKGTTLFVFANGEFLEDVSDDTYFLGNFGLYANAATTPGLTVYFDEFHLWFLSS